MKNIKRKQKKVSFLILFCIVAAPVIFGKPISTVMAAEQDEEDNFTAMPNWRWANETTTDADAQESLLGNDYYQMDLANLDPDDNMKLEKSRQLIDRDFFVDQKFQMELGGNKVEFFRDVIGDPCDFAEGDYEYIDSSVPRKGLLNESNLFYQTNPTNWDLLISTVLAEIPINMPMVALDSVEMRYKLETTTEDTIRIATYFASVSEVDPLDDTGTAHISRVNVDLEVNEWTILTINSDEYTSTSHWESTGSAEMFYIYPQTNFDSDTNDIFYIDYLRFYFNLDYATHAKGEIEDALDWNDGLEYYYNVKEDINDFDTFVDYFKDVEGNVSDFNDGSIENWASYHGTSRTNVNNWLKMVDTSGDGITGLQQFGLNIDASTYEWLSIQIISNVTVNTITIYDGGSGVVSSDSTGWAADTYYTLDWDLSLDADWTGTETGLYIRFDTVGASEISTNYVYLLGTEKEHVESWVADNTESLSNEDNWLSIRETDYHISIHSTGQSIVSATYKWLTIEVEIVSTAPQTELWRIEVRDDADHSVGQVNYNTVYANGSRFLFSLNLDLDADWTGTETSLEIVAVFNDSASPKFKEIAYNMVFLYDVELGDLEALTGDGGNGGYSFVNPIGYITAAHGDKDATPARDEFYTPTDVRLRETDISAFPILKTRIRIREAPNPAQQVNVLIDWYPTVGGYVGSGSVITQISENDGWIDIEYDLRTDQQYDNLPLKEYGNSRFGEKYSNNYVEFDIDYFLFIGNFTSSPIKFSLLNQAHEEAVYFQFSKTDSLTDNYTFDIDFLDSVGVVLHYSTTFLYSLDDGWLYLEFDLNINKKLFKILLEYENGTDIVKTRSMYALYGQIGTPNLLISKVGDPVYCMNMSQEPFGHAYVVIDYIDADWKILAWNQPSGTSPDLGKDSIGDPYSFDQSFPADILNQYTLDFVGEIYTGGAFEKAYSWFYLDIDKFDGVSMDITGWGDNLESGDSLITRIFFANVRTNGSLDVLLMFKQSLKPTSQYGLLWFEDDGTRHVSDWVNGMTYETESTLSVYMDTTNNELIAQARVDTGAGASETLGANVSRVEQLTEEMVIFITYEYTDYAATADDDEWKVQISGFDLMRKGWIEDIVSSVLKGITDLIAIAFSPFIMFFTWLLSGLVVLGRFIVDGLQPFFDVLGAIFTTAINGLQVAFGTIIDGLELALTTALGTLETAVDGITTALSNLAGQIWTAFLSLVDDLSSLVESILLDMVSWIDDLYQSILNDWLFAMFDDLMAELGLTELVLFISDFVVDMLQVLGYVIGIASAFMGFMFAMGTYWLVPERLSAAGLAIFMIIMAWLFYPLLMLFMLFVDGDFDSDEWITHVESFADKLFLVISTTMSILSYIVNFIIQALITIGGFIPFT